MIKHTRNLICLIVILSSFLSAFSIPDAYKTMNQTASYNSFNKIKSIEEIEHPSGKLLYAWQGWYGPGEELVLQKITTSGVGARTRTRRIFNAYETEGAAAKSYVYLPDGSLVGWASGNNFYFTLRDHLGSVIAVLDQNGNIQQHLSYDAWGRRRDPATWNYASNLPAPPTTKGFTRHEHLDDFKLINMRGRMYDPVLGRFLSPDIIVQFPENSQSYNRYSYCLNNPLRYTDPTGWAEWELNRRTGKIDWLNDNKHFIERDDEMVEVDKLINSRGKSIDVSTGILGRSIGDDFQSYAFANAVEAENFYYFVAESSNVEWAFARLNIKNFENAFHHVGTNNRSGSTSMPSYYENRYGDYIDLMSHSHPIGGSGYGHPSYNIYDYKKGIYAGDLNNANESDFKYLRQVYDVSKGGVWEYSKDTKFPDPSERKGNKVPYYDRYWDIKKK